MYLLASYSIILNYEQHGGKFGRVWAEWKYWSPQEGHKWEKYVVIDNPAVSSKYLRELISEPRLSASNSSNKSLTLGVPLVIISVATMIGLPLLIRLSAWSHFTSAAIQPSGLLNRSLPGYLCRSTAIQGGIDWTRSWQLLNF